AVESHLRQRLQERDDQLRARDRVRIAESPDRRALVAPTRARRNEVHQLAKEQAALRRLATAVASGVPAGEIFRAVAEEVAPLLGADDAAVVRFELDRTATVVAGAGRCL